MSEHIGWEDLIRSDAPAHASLQSALFTTYDRADTRLLAENVLPVFLRLSHQAAFDGNEKQHFLLDLDKALKDRHGQIVVVSSTVRDEPVIDSTSEQQGSGTAYPWILPLIREHGVGRTGRAVQHAKLWFVHWSTGDGSGDEYLEIVVSSANLTRAAFRGQIQCAWRVCLPLRAVTSVARLEAWGVLPTFLSLLAQSAGVRDGFANFPELLARADCPAGVTFVASVPGTHSPRTLRRTAWGMSGLKAIVPPGAGTLSCTVLSPYVGGWTTDTVSAWAGACGADPRRLELVWIEETHPWAYGRHWTLPRASLHALMAVGARVHALPHQRGDDAVFHESHSTADMRWSHAKAYRFKCGRTTTVLLTSANFSPSAWGFAAADGRLTIRNFELGVAIADGVWPIADLPCCSSPASLFTVDEELAEPPAGITWAWAQWDGISVTIECMTATPSLLRGRIISRASDAEIPQWEESEAEGVHAATVVWTDADCPPQSVVLRMGAAETLTISVFDARSRDDRDSRLPDDVDPATAQAIQDALLFEKYDGRFAFGMEESLGTADFLDPPSEITRPIIDSYAVPAIERAREDWAVVDSWSSRLQAARTLFELETVQSDGARLCEAFKRESARRRLVDPTLALGAMLALEELDARSVRVSAVNEKPSRRRMK